MKNIRLLLILLSTMIFGSEAPFKGRISSQEFVVNIIEKAGNGDLAGVQECLVNGVNINTKGEYGYTALMGAVDRHHVEMVKFLVENGADINIKNDYDMTALNSSYLSDINYDGDQEMWDAMAEFDAINKPKNREILKYLIENGADTSVKNSSGYPILIWAIQEWEIEIVEVLVANKADLEARDKKGNTAIMHVRNMEIIKILVEGGADVNALNNDGRNALMDASDHANLDIVKYLIEKGADINVKDNEGRTALDLARENGYTIVVEYLESLQ